MKDREVIQKLFGEVNVTLVKTLAGPIQKVEGLKLSALSKHRLVVITPEEAKEAYNKAKALHFEKTYWELLTPPVEERPIDIDRLIIIRSQTFDNGLMTGADDIPLEPDGYEDDDLDQTIQYTKYQEATKAVDAAIPVYKTLKPIWDVLNDNKDKKDEKDDNNTLVQVEGLLTALNSTGLRLFVKHHETIVTKLMKKMQETLKKRTPSPSNLSAAGTAPPKTPPSSNAQF